MNVEVAVRMYRGGAAQRWHRLSGNGGCSWLGRTWLVMRVVARTLCSALWEAGSSHFLRGLRSCGRGDLQDPTWNLGAIREHNERSRAAHFERWVISARPPVPERRAQNELDEKWAVTN